MIEQMFGHADSVIGLWPGERPDDLPADDVLAYELTCRLLADWVDDDQHVLPSGFDDLPHRYQAVVVSGLDPSRLNGYDVVRLMKAEARLSSHFDARKYEAMAEVAFSPPGDADSGVFRLSEQVDYAAVEIAAGLSLTRRASEDQLSRAASLAGRLRRVHDLFLSGALDVHRVRVFDSVLGHLPDDTVDTVLDQVLDDAAELTTGQLRARLSRLVMVADPDGAKSSYEEGLLDRHVATGSNPDHTADFGIYSAPPDRVAAARAHVEQRARALRVVGDERTLDQLRVDVAFDLLAVVCDHRDHAGSGGGRVNVSITAETLAGLSDEPAILEGFGPVIAEIGRKTVMENLDGEWRFTATDQAGSIATGTLSRRPTACQTRRVAAEYSTCVMVGCRMPVYECDLDHRKPRAKGGATHTDNLEPLCRHHHMVRHHTQWQVERLPNGDHLWTSPLGHVYIKRRGPPD